MDKGDETMVVYCARWKEYGGGWAESRTSWEHLETLVFGQPYAPSKGDVSFTTRKTTK